MANDCVVGRREVSSSILRLRGTCTGTIHTVTAQLGLTGIGRATFGQVAGSGGCVAAGDAVGS